MKFLVVLAFIGAASAQNQYIWDLLNPALNAAEVQAILTNAKAGSDYPNYDQIPQTNFDCSSKKQSGFYADVDTKCQVFHRCDINGNLTSYLCVNTTVFNQLTLVCDYYFNVDCSKAQSFENFANSRLYQGENVQLFDTPPADYQTPQQKQQAADAEVIASGGQVPSNNNKPAPKPAPSNGKKGATTKKPSGTPKPSIQNRSDTGDNTINVVQPGRNVPAKPFRGVTPKAPIRATTTTTTASSSEAASEDTTAISSEETSAASSEDTSAASSEATSASGEDTTAASSDETSAASSEDTTAASSDETSAASSEDTTAAAGGDESTASSEAGSDSTAAGGEDTTTASA